MDATDGLTSPPAACSPTSHSDAHSPPPDGRHVGECGTLSAGAGERTAGGEPHLLAAVVTRENLFTRGRLRPFSWLYTVTIDGARYTGEGLGWVRSLCKRVAPGAPIVFAWLTAEGRPQP